MNNNFENDIREDTLQICKLLDTHSLDGLHLIYRCDLKEGKRVSQELNNIIENMSRFSNLQELRAYMHEQHHISLHDVHDYTKEDLKKGIKYYKTKFKTAKIQLEVMEKFAEENNIKFFYK